MQQRLRKFRREQGALLSRRITDRSLALLAFIERYRLLPSSLLLRLAGGSPRITYRHLQTLYHRGLVNRFAFPRIGNPGEFHYYLDNTRSLELLIDSAGASPDALDFEGVRRNRRKDYASIHDPARVDEMQGRLMFLKHEAMISRFHAMLELACRGREVRLVDWQQGAALRHSVGVPGLIYENGGWAERDDNERLPHWPDAFFTLRFHQPGGSETEAHFFYEADRKHTSTKKFNRKLRAHFYYVVKRHLHQKHYGVRHIRAVLIETIDPYWGERLRGAARHETVSGPKSSPLFWFTTSTLFTKVTEPGAISQSSFLADPAIIFQRIWATPVDDTLHGLLD
jgi:hypothetical protein